MDVLWCNVREVLLFHKLIGVRCTKLAKYPQRQIGHAQTRQTSLYLRVHGKLLKCKMLYIYPTSRMLLRRYRYYTYFGTENAITIQVVLYVCLTADCSKVLLKLMLFLPMCN